MTHTYRLIRLWHKETGSMAYYIDQQVERAQKTNAPEDALYEIWEHQGTAASGPTGEWITLRDLPEGHPFRAKAEEA
jgi:hypothetical protein